MPEDTARTARNNGAIGNAVFLAAVADGSVALGIAQPEEVRNILFSLLLTMEDVSK